MMKKAGILLMAMLYLGIALGVGLNIHYCFGRVSSIEVNQSAKNCRLLKLTKLPDCCKSKHIDLKVKDSHQLMVIKPAFTLPVLSLPARTFAALNVDVRELIFLQPAYRGPPDQQIGTTPLFIKNCTFLI